MNLHWSPDFGLIFSGSLLSTPEGDISVLQDRFFSGELAHTLKAVVFMRKLIVIMVLFCTTGAAGQTLEEARQKIEGMYWMTEQYPPFNFVDEKDGKLKGITVDILMEMFRKIGVKKTRDDLEVLPWARGYKYLLERPGTALFSTTYTVERLQRFKFVGPVIPTQVSVIAKKSKGLEIVSVEDMDRLEIGVIRDDIGAQLIRALGVNKDAIQQKSSAFSMVQMLHKGRLDAIAYAEDIAKYQFMLAGIDPNQYEPVYVLQKSHMGYTFHHSTDPRVLEPLRKALDELRTNGTVDKVYARYLNPATSENLGTQSK